MKPKLKTIANQPSWVVRNDTVEMAITQQGGHLAPVTFFPDSGKSVQPYWISPWDGTKCKLPPALGVLRPLRGDFFCMPFGANAKPLGDEQYPVHGEPAVRKWTFRKLEKQDAVTTLTLSMNTRIRKGRIVKKKFLVDGQSAVYSTHTLSGFTGSMPIAHHHTLALPDEPETVHVASSPIFFGMTNPTPAGDPAEGEYPSLAGGEKFGSFTRVPSLFKKPAFVDCSKFPTRKGFGDVLQIFQKPGKNDTPAWVAATYTTEGFLWYSLKEVAVMPSTLFWMYNHSRWSHPWAGQSACLGLENTCSFFAEGQAESTQPNALRRAGIRTATKLSPTAPTDVRVIQGVVRVPRGFGKVSKAEFSRGKVTFFSGTKKTSTRVNWEFLFTGEL